MRGRAFLVYSIVVSTLELAGLLAVMLWVLPSVGIDVSAPVVVLVSAASVVISIVLTVVNLRAVDLRPIRSPDIGVRAVVVRSLTPKGYVRVGNELWPAMCDTGSVERGREVTVVHMDRLRLVVRPLERTRQGV